MSTPRVGIGSSTILLDGFCPCHELFVEFQTLKRGEREDHKRSEDIIR